MDEELNLDGYTDIDLLDFTRRYLMNAALLAKELFPDESITQRERAVVTLYDYAMLTLAARYFRRSGAINKALNLEQDAERAYKQLPNFARW